MLSPQTLLATSPVGTCSLLAGQAPGRPEGAGRGGLALGRSSCRSLSPQSARSDHLRRQDRCLTAVSPSQSLQRVQLQCLPSAAPHYLSYFLELFTGNLNKVSVNQIKVHFRGDSGASHSPVVGRPQGGLYIFAAFFCEAWPSPCHCGG